jgi:aspartate/methionine/tyrosine aminotransferase
LKNYQTNNKPTGSLISFFSNKVKQNGGINLAQGLPGFDPPLLLKNYLIEASSQPVHQYASGYGLDNLRAYAANDLESASIKPQNILITNGGTEAISLLYLYLYVKNNKSLNVLSFSPVYESYSQLPFIYGNKFFEFFLTSDYEVDLSLLEQSIISNNINLIFLSSPGNPLGKVFSKNTFNQIIQFCQKHKVTIVIDMVYKHLYFDNKPYYPFEALGTNVFFVDSFSKQFSITGWRLGYLVADSNQIQKIASIHDYTGLSAPHPLQYALGKFVTMSLNEANDYKLWIKEHIGNNIKLARSTLSKNGFECADTQGGFFIWAKIPSNHTDGFIFADQLYNQKQVAIVPGEHFGLQWKEYIRINVAHPINQLSEGLNKMIEL